MADAIDISTPLPIAQDGEPAWILDADMANLLARKIEAFSNMVAEYPLVLVPSDAGPKLVLVQ